MILGGMSATLEQLPGATKSEPKLSAYFQRWPPTRARYSVTPLAQRVMVTLTAAHRNPRALASAMRIPFRGSGDPVPQVESHSVARQMSRATRLFGYSQATAGAANPPRIVATAITAIALLSLIFTSVSPNSFLPAVADVQRSHPGAAPMIT